MNTKINKKAKSDRILFWVIGLFLMLGLAGATSVITDEEITSPIIETSLYGNFSQIEIGNNSGLSLQASQRKLVSLEDKTINICSSGCDYTTIQEGLNQIPIFLRHKYIIQIHNGEYDEDLWIPSYFSSDITHATEGSYRSLVIQGNTTNRNLVKINSIHMSGGGGAISPVISYISFTGNDSFSDESCSACFYGVTRATVNYVNFSESKSNVAVMAYSSGVSFQNADLGDDGHLIWGALAKHGGQIYVGNADYSTNISLIGNVSSAIFTVSAGSYITYEQVEVGSPKIANCQGGLIFNDNTNVIYCAGSLGTFVNQGTSINMNDTLWINQTQNKNSLIIDSVASTARVVDIEAQNVDGDVVSIRNSAGHVDQTNMLLKIVQDSSASTSSAVSIHNDGSGLHLQFQGSPKGECGSGEYGFFQNATGIYVCYNGIGTKLNE